MLLLLLYTQFMAIGLLGLILVGIRSERRRMKADYQEAIDKLKLVSYGRRSRRP